MLSEKNNKYKLYIIKLDDNTIHEVTQYIKKKENIINILCETYPNELTLGVDCEFYKEKKVVKLGKKIHTISYREGFIDGFNASNSI
jgi:hypothetical protein